MIIDDTIDRLHVRIRPHHRKRIFFLAAVALFSLVGAFMANSSPQAPLVVHFFNVGQGDSTLIHTDSNIDILIDGGPDDTILQKLSETLPATDHTIELVILTHPHADHVSGLVSVLDRYRVEKIITTGVTHTSNTYLSWLKKIKEKNIPTEIATANQKYHFKDSAGTPLSLTILYPMQSLAGTDAPSDHLDTGGGLNDTSVVARLDYNEQSFLFTGDASSVIESTLLTAKQSIAATVLKIGHHGSRYSTSKRFLEAVRPRYAVIQVGKNNYGHPAPATLQTLAQEQVKIFRTDTDGDITMLTDGKTLTTKSSKRP